MAHENAILLSGYMAGVVFGSIISVTIYKILLKSGKLEDSAVDKADGAEEEVAR